MPTSGRCVASCGLALAAWLALDGTGLTAEDPKSLAAVQADAQQGDAGAQRTLGARYAEGIGVTQDDAEAVKWFRRAAEQWHNLAQHNLGFMYHAGRGVTQSDTEAMRWFHRARDQRSSLSPTTLGGIYHLPQRGLGMGLPNDLALAYFWFTIAVVEGDANAQTLRDKVASLMTPAQTAEAQQLLREWGKTSNKTLEDWVFLLGAIDPEVSKQARKHVTDAGAEAVPALIAALKTADGSELFRELCWALYMIGSPAREAAPTLEALLATRPPADRTMIALALADIDPERGKVAAPELDRCARERARPAWYRGMCVRVLSKVSGVEIAPALLVALGDDDAELRAEAAHGLRKAPADTVRGPLGAKLRDPALAVRVRAASSLLLAVPDPPASAQATLLEGVCKGTAQDADLVASTLEDIAAKVTVATKEALSASLRGSDPQCRTWAAVALGRVDVRRALPGLGLLRQALASKDDRLRHAAAWTLGAMGPPAREALAELEQAASADPSLRYPAERLRRGPSNIEECRLEDLRFVAAGRRQGVNTAYVLHANGNLWEVKQGQRLFDGEIERVDADALTFRGQSGDASSTTPARTQLKLFQKGEPAPLSFDPKEYTGEPLSIDLDADVTSLAMLVGHFSRINLVLEGGTTGRVRIAGRNAPWDLMLERALQAGGFGRKLERDYLRVGGRDQMAKMRPLSSSKHSGHPISLQFRHGDIRDIARLFADISGLGVEIPDGPYEPVTIFVSDVPWDQAFDLIVASLGWTHRIDGSVIRVEAPKAER